jgi:hypothetical protein
MTNVEGHGPAATAKSDRDWKSALIGGIAGALGTTIVGLVFSSATLTFLSNLVGHNVLPSSAAIFVTGADCGAVGNGWKKFQHAEGRFLVGAGTNSDFNKTFQADVTNVGTLAIKIEEKHLPSLKANIPFVISNFAAQNGGYGVVRELAPKGGDAVRFYELSMGGQSVSIDTLPPSVALTACTRS